MGRKGNRRSRRRRRKRRRRRRRKKKKKKKKKTKTKNSKICNNAPATRPLNWFITLRCFRFLVSSSFIAAATCASASMGSKPNEWSFCSAFFFATDSFFSNIGGFDSDVSAALSTMFPPILVVAAAFFG